MRKTNKNYDYNDIVLHLYVYDKEHTTLEAEYVPDFEHISGLMYSVPIVKGNERQNKEVNDILVIVDRT